MTLSVIEENYLKKLFNLSKNLEQSVPLNELSSALGVKMPSANSMIKRLAEKGLVKYDLYKPISLTEEGYNIAVMILRRHRLTEKFLFEFMGLAWDEVHEIAEQMEHIKSSVFFDKMDELLNYPTTDPHGETIPTSKGEIKEDENLLSISKCNIGDIVLLKSILGCSDTFLKFLNKKNIQLNSKLKILDVEKYDESIVVLCDEKNIEVITKMVSDKLVVKKI